MLIQWSSLSGKHFWRTWLMYRRNPLSIVDITTAKQNTMKAQVYIMGHKNIIHSFTRQNTWDRQIWLPQFEHWCQTTRDKVSIIRLSWAQTCFVSNISIRNSKTLCLTFTWNGMFNVTSWCWWVHFSIACQYQRVLYKLIGGFLHDKAFYAAADQDGKDCAQFKRFHPGRDNNSWKN